MQSYVRPYENLSRSASFDGYFNSKRSGPGSKLLKVVREKLRTRMKHSAWGDDDDKGFFLPKSALVEILTDETVHNLLSESSATAPIKSSKITGTDKRVEILATLLLIPNGINYIGRFIGKSVCDNQLPIPREKLELYFPSEYDFSKADSFFEYQHWIHVPTLRFSSYEILREDFKRRCMLPFMKKEELSRGGQGIVWKVKIHEDHYESRALTNEWSQLHRGPDFAIKEFRDSCEFEKELEASKQCSEPGSRHKHLMKALFAFSHGTKRFLILPLAHGNLNNLCRTITPSRQNLRFLLEQCLCIADGLKNIHEYNADRLRADERIVMGRHGDIKPQNILWFNDPSAKENRLVLSDFTLMRFHTQGANDETTLRDIGGTQTYRAPETDVWPRRHVSQKYDVWSLGCVFLEFISCYILGYEATHGEHSGTNDGQDQSFRRMRQIDDNDGCNFSEDKYFIRSRDKGFEAQVKNSVKAWFLHLHGSAHCSEALHSFLKIIENHMLVPSPDNRLSMKELVETLDKMVNYSHVESHEDATERFHEGKPGSSCHQSKLPTLWDGGASIQALRRPHKIQFFEHSDATDARRSPLTSVPQSPGATLKESAGAKPDMTRIRNVTANDFLRKEVPVTSYHNVINSHVRKGRCDEAYPHISCQMEEQAPAEDVLDGNSQSTTSAGGSSTPPFQFGQALTHTSDLQTDLPPSTKDGHSYNMKTKAGDQKVPYQRVFEETHAIDPGEPKFEGSTRSLAIEAKEPFILRGDEAIQEGGNGIETPSGSAEHSHSACLGRKATLKTFRYDLQNRRAAPKNTMDARTDHGVQGTSDDCAAEVRIPVLRAFRSISRERLRVMWSKLRRRME